MATDLEDFAQVMNAAFFNDLLPSCLAGAGEMLETVHSFRDHLCTGGRIFQLSYKGSHHATSAEDPMRPRLVTEEGVGQSDSRQLGLDILGACGLGDQSEMRVSLQASILD